MKELILLLIMFAVLPVAFSSDDVVRIGKFQSRGIFTRSAVKSPAIILIPGSGPHGPEGGVMPPELTADHKLFDTFKTLKKPFVIAGWNVLALGKPGIEIFTGFEKEKRYYNEKLYVNMYWSDLITNVKAAVGFLKSQTKVDSSRIYLLGHSQGTWVAVDYASLYPGEVAGLYLLGYAGQNIKQILEWQLYRRPIEHFVATDVDLDKDGVVTKAEASRWSGPISLDGELFDWNFPPGKTSITLNDIESELKKKKEYIDLVSFYASSNFYSKGQFERTSLHDKVAKLKIPVRAYNGSEDLLTKASEVTELSKACLRLKKNDCHVTIVPGVGHVFSYPKSPGKHSLIDITYGPIDEGFLKVLEADISR